MKTLLIRQFLDKLRLTTVVAINGCLNSKPLIEYLKLQKDYTIINKSYQDIFEECNGLEDYIANHELKNNSIYNICLNDTNQEKIVKVFRTLCDKINYQDKFNNSKSFLIVSGDWDTKLLIDKLKDDGVSYHFNEGNNLIYSMDLRIESKDSNMYKDGYYSEDRKDNWEYILDFSKGDLFSTWFLSEIIQDQTSLGQKNQTVQSHCNNFMSYFEDSTLWSDLERNFKNHNHIHSFKTQTNLPEYDQIKRSNLFQQSSRSGDSLVFKTNHYLSRYTLYNLGREEPNISYQPQFPVLRKHMSIAEDVLDIEKEVKHVLKNYFTYKGINIDKIPINISSSNGSYIFNAYKLYSPLNKMVRPSGSNNPEIKNYINLLTFGGLVRLMTGIEDIYTIINEFDIGDGKATIPNNKLFKLENKTGDHFSSEEKSVRVKLDRGDLIHLNKISFKKKTQIITVIKEKESKCDYYAIQSDKIKDQIIGTSYVIPYLDHNRENDSQHTSLFKNYGEIKNLLEDIRHFRNAVLHNRYIDDSEFDDFDKKIARFYDLIAIN